MLGGSKRTPILSLSEKVDHAVYSVGPALLNLVKGEVQGSRCKSHNSRWIKKREFALFMYFALQIRPILR